MIKIIDNVFHINTRSTSYIMRVNKYNDIEHLYYGKSIDVMDDYSAFVEERCMLLVNGLYMDGDVSYGMDDICYEISAPHRGDMRDSAVSLRDAQGVVFSFKYCSHSIGNQPNNAHQAASYGCDDTLCITLKDELRDVQLNLWYLVYSDCDVITRMTELVNKSGKTVNIDKIMSAQLDLHDSEYELINFSGAWSRERHKEVRRITRGKHVIESLSGYSSGKHNPLIMLRNINGGGCYGMNLVYSGNHAESIEVCQYDHTRVLQGINPTGFTYAVEDRFITPESVLTYACNDNQLSQNYHDFVNEHIVRGYWKGKEKPLLANSWETMTFNICEDKILALADKAKEVGAEILVVDDGWFNKRNDDTTSLGDWFCDVEKFPKGVKYIADKVHERGLLFGLWFEPEMISVDSDLYRNHPEYALKIEGIAPIVGRNQLILDLANAEVQDYLINIVSGMISENNIDYVKWDCNRQFSDIVARGHNDGETMHRYILGLYRVQQEITARCPKTLFELCSAGGNRYDLGVLCYSPIGWVSDNTDVYSRTCTQEGTSYGYPISTMCCHISDVPNYQTKRVTRLVDRYNIASFGVLGMQMDLTDLKEDFDELKHYVNDYKQWRGVMQFGKFYRLIDGACGNTVAWECLDKAADMGRVMVFNKRFEPVSKTIRVKLLGLDARAMYELTEENSDLPHKVVTSGGTLMNSGLILRQNYQGNEMQPTTRLMTDYTSILYSIKKLK